MSSKKNTILSTFSFKKSINFASFKSTDCNSGTPRLISYKILFLYSSTTLLSKFSEFINPIIIINIYILSFIFIYLIYYYQFIYYYKYILFIILFHKSSSKLYTIKSLFKTFIYYLYHLFIFIKKLFLSLKSNFKIILSFYCNCNCLFFTNIFIYFMSFLFIIFFFYLLKLSFLFGILLLFINYVEIFYVIKPNIIYFVY